MRTFGMVVGGLISLFGLSIMLTPLRTYFLIGWITGAVLLCNALPMLFSGLRRKTRSLSRIIVGGITAVVALLLLFTHFQQILTQVIIVYLVAGGIMLSGFIECIIGYQMTKKGNSGLPTLITGGISFAIGLCGLIFQQTTVIVIGIIVGVHILRIGASIFFAAKNMDKPLIINLND